MKEKYRETKYHFYFSAFSYHNPAWLVQHAKSKEIFERKEHAQITKQKLATYTCSTNTDQKKFLNIVRQRTVDWTVCDGGMLTRWTCANRICKQKNSNLGVKSMETSAKTILAQQFSGTFMQSISSKVFNIPTKVRSYLLQIKTSAEKRKQLWQAHVQWQ